MDISYIAYCGVNCSDCVDLKNDKCPGCRKTEWKNDDICMPVLCCKKKGVSLCGECAEFPCKDMEAFYHESKSHEKAYELMHFVHNKGR